jgi:NodT family efflux transporter outer membrane factor (OMF) lipoprotein
VALALALAVSACTTSAPRQQRQAVVPAPQWDQAGSGNSPSRDWWQAFGVEPLNGLVQQAAAANLDVQIAVARVRQADAQAAIAGAARWPGLALLGSEQRLRNGATTAPSARQTTGRDNVALSLAASYQVDFWGTNASTARAAAGLAQASRFDRQTVALTIESQVASTYFSALALQERLALARNNLANAEHTLDAIRARAQAGIASELDIAQQQGLVEAQRALIPPLELQWQKARTALALLLGQAPEGFALPGPGTRLAQARLPSIGAGVPASLLRRRPDIQSAEAQLASVDASLQAAEAARFPNLTLSLEAGRSGAAWSALSGPAALFYTVGASLAQPLLDGGAIQGRIDLQRGRWQEVDALYRQRVLTAFKDVEDALSAVAQNARLVDTQRTVVQASQQAYDIAQARLFTGTIDILTVLTTQTTLFQSQDLLLQDQLAQLQAGVQLFLALGGGWSVDEQGG